MGKREPSMMPTAVRRLCGHVRTGPSRVLDQSSCRIRAPISPPPGNKRAVKSASANGSSEKAEKDIELADLFRLAGIFLQI